MKSASAPMFIRCFRNIMCKVKTLFFLGNRIFQGALDVLYILLILIGCWYGSFGIKRFSATNQTIKKWRQNYEECWIYIEYIGYNS